MLPVKQGSLEDPPKYSADHVCSPERETVIGPENRGIILLCERHCQLPGNSVIVSSCSKKVIHKFFRRVYKVYSYQCVTTYKMSTVILSNKKIYDWIGDNLWTIGFSMCLGVLLMKFTLFGVKIQSCEDILVEYDLQLNQSHRYSRNCRTFFTIPYAIQFFSMLGYTIMESFLVASTPITLEKAFNYDMKPFINKTIMEVIMLIFTMSVGSTYLAFQTKYSIFKLPAVLNSIVWCLFGVVWVVFYELFIGIPICLEHKKDPLWTNSVYFPMSVISAAIIALSYHLWILYSSQKVLNTRDVHLGDELSTLLLTKYYYLICLCNVWLQN